MIELPGFEFDAQHFRLNISPYFIVNDVLDEHYIVSDPLGNIMLHRTEKELLEYRFVLVPKRKRKKALEVLAMRIIGFL